MTEPGQGIFAGLDAPPVLGAAKAPTRCILDGDPRGRRALVTGASSGIGKAFAEALAAMGWDLTLVARDEARLNALKERFTSENGVNVKVVRADLTTRKDMERVQEEIGGDESLRLVINNAGVSVVQPMAECEIDRMDDMVQLNSVALVRLTHAALQGLIARGEGAIVNVSSAGAFVCPPTSAVYCASKAFVNAFTESVAMEVEGTGVQVQALCPGMTISELADRGGFDVSWAPSWMTAEQVVEACFAGLRLGEVVCVPGLQDPALVVQMREAGGAVVGQTINSIVAPRYLESAPAKA